MLGEDLNVSGFKFDGTSFRLEQPSSNRGVYPEIILCGVGPYPRDSGTVIELPADAIPVSYLLH